MEGVFGSSGRLANTLAGYEPRAEQAELAEAVARALDRGEHLLAEAGTGVGKSLAYLIPALASGRRVVVATATKALQQQLLTKDVPAAATALRRDLDVALLKGRQNYLCRKSAHGLELLGGALLRKDSDAAAYDRLRPWLESTETGDRAELDFEPSPALWAELSVGSDRCSGRRCHFVASCFAEAARERASDSDLVIANHALYFADLGLRTRGDAARVLPEHDAVVFDEAHRLEESAATWLGGRVTGAGLTRLASDVDRACRESGRPVPAAPLDRVFRTGETLLAAVAPKGGRMRVRPAPIELGRPFVVALGGLADALAGCGDELDAIARRALVLAAEMEACLESDPLDLVVWAEPGTLAWAPVEVGPRLRELLWADGPTAVLVSATLATAGDFGFVRSRLGLDDARELVLGSPFDFESQALLYVPRDLPEPRSPGSLERIAEETIDLCALSRGRALVLVTSYRALDELAARVRDRVAYPLLVQGEEPRERLLERFRSDVDSILLATSTFWQGVDIRGESLSLLVIEKLPFGAPGDPIAEARCERIVDAGGDWFREYVLPQAVLQLRQGFGRLIRGLDDRGVVALLDPRVRTRTYGRAFLEALQPCPITSDKEEVAGFFHESGEKAVATLAARGQEDAHSGTAP